MAVISDSSYGSPADVVFSFPVQVDGERSWEIVKELQVDDSVRSKLDDTGKELLREREEALAVACQMALA